MPQERLTKQIFLGMYHSNETNWCKELYNIFSQIDMQHVFHNKTVCNLDLCKEKLMELAQNDWKELILTKPKLRTCINFKKELGIEKYVLNIRNKYGR